jgi:hypothetical protein
MCLARLTVNDFAKIDMRPVVMWDHDGFLGRADDGEGNVSSFSLDSKFRLDILI